MEIEKYIFIAFYIFILCRGICTFATMLVWRTEDNLKQSVLNMCPRDQLQAWCQVPLTC